MAGRGRFTFRMHFPEQHVILKIAELYLAKAPEPLGFVEGQIAIVPRIKYQATTPGILCTELFNGFQQQPAIAAFWYLGLTPIIGNWWASGCGSMSRIFSW